MKVSLENCTFQNLTTYYIINKNSGGAILIAVSEPMSVKDCLFQVGNFKKFRLFF